MLHTVIKFREIGDFLFLVVAGKSLKKPLSCVDSDSYQPFPTAYEPAFDDEKTVHSYHTGSAIKRAANKYRPESPQR